MAALNALSKLLGLRTLKRLNLSTPCRSGDFYLFKALVGTLVRWIPEHTDAGEPGKVSFNSSSRLPANSAVRAVSPVMFPLAALGWQQAQRQPDRYRLS